MTVGRSCLEESANEGGGLVDGAAHDAAGIGHDRGGERLKLGVALHVVAQDDPARLPRLDGGDIVDG